MAGIWQNLYSDGTERNLEILKVKAHQNLDALDPSDALAIALAKGNDAADVAAKAGATMHAVDAQVADVVKDSDMPEASEPKAIAVMTNVH